MLRWLRRKRGVLHQTKTSNLYELLERILNKGMFIRGGRFSRQVDVGLVIHRGINFFAEQMAMFLLPKTTFEARSHEALAQRNSHNAK